MKWSAVYYRKMYWLNSKLKACLPFSLRDFIFILLYFLQTSPPFSSLDPLPTLWRSQLNIHRFCYLPVISKGACCYMNKDSRHLPQQNNSRWNAHIYRWPCSIYNVNLESPVEIWLWVTAPLRSVQGSWLTFHIWAEEQLLSFETRAFKTSLGPVQV